MTARAGGLLLLPAALLAILAVLAACGAEDRADEDAFCTTLRQSIDQNVTVFDPQDPADPAETLAVLDELAELAPADIEPDVLVLRDAFAELADAIDELNVNDPAAADQLAEIDLDDERIARAQTAMATYGRDPCRVPLLGGPESVTTTTPATTTIPGTTSTQPPGAEDPID